MTMIMAAITLSPTTVVDDQGNYPNVSQRCQRGRQQLNEVSVTGISSQQ